VPENGLYQNVLGTNIKSNCYFYENYVTRSIFTEKKLKYFQPQNTTSEAMEIARSILHNVLNDSVTDSMTDNAFDFVKEIVNSSFESTQKPTAIPVVV